MTRLNAFGTVGGLALSTLLAATAGAQTSTLYVTDGDSSRLAIVQGGNVTVMRTHLRGYPITVDGSVWIGDYNGAQPNTIEYDLAGNPTGAFLPYSPVFAVDATTDGNVAYELGNAFSSNATVYSLNKDLSGAPAALFSVSGSADIVGITFDSASGNLWVSSGSMIWEYTTGGSLVSSWAHSSGRGCIAYESATDTLWYVPNGADRIVQYDKAGNLLQTVSTPGLAANNWGAEFEFGGAPRFTIRLSGSCPGPKTLSWNNAGSGQMGILIANGSGNYTLPTGPCAGTQLGLSGPGGLSLYNIIGTQGGSGQVSQTVGTPACGKWIQCIKTNNCATSNATGPI